MRVLVSAALTLSACALRAEASESVADQLAAKFAAFCMADPSPYKAANDAANGAKLAVNQGLTGVDTPTPAHIVSTQTWNAGELGGATLSLVATNVDSGKCRVQACGLVAERFKGGGIETALAKRLGLPAPIQRTEDNGGIQAAWPLTTSSGRIVSFAAQKSLAGDRVTITVAQLCSQS